MGGKGRFFALLCAGWLAGISVTARADTAQGSVEGHVKDALDRPLADVALRLETPSGSVAGRTTSDANGRFSFQKIDPGVYSVVGEKEQFETATAVVTVAAGEAARSELVLASTTPLNLNVVAQRLDERRAAITPAIGASHYDITQQAIEAQPHGEDTPFNQVILRTPGVANDSYGQLHVRGEHANLQYRINGILLPAGVATFASVLDTRMVSNASLLTGALPAQYGYRTAGVVDIQTKEGTLTPQASLGMYGGSEDWIQPSVEASGSSGIFNYFVTSTYMQNDRGLEPPTPNAIHDFTRQARMFGVFSAVPDPTTRVSLALSGDLGYFNIPNNPHQQTAFDLTGFTTFDSRQVDEQQHEINPFGILSLQKTVGKLDFQLAAFSQYNGIKFDPDYDPDLLFNGVASRVFRGVLETGVEGDGAYHLNDSHTLRGGFFFSTSRGDTNTTSRVFPTDAAGDQTSDVPFSIDDDAHLTTYLYGLYLQDEWKVLPEVTINGGVRIDYYDGFVQKYQVSPRLNVVYRPFETTTLHAGYARYFTPPPLELLPKDGCQKFAGTTNACQVDTGIQTVTVERAHYFDLGILQQILPQWQVGLDGYYKLAKDQLDDGQFGAALVFSPFNYEKGTIYGVELTSNYQLGALSAYGNLALSYAKGRNASSAQFLWEADELAYAHNHSIWLDHDQRWSSTLGLSYILWDTRMYVENVLGSGLRQGFANTMKMPDAEQVNLGASRAFELPTLGRFTARFDLVNLFDKENQIRSGSGIGVFAAQRGPERGFFGGLTKEF
ncbi:MAG TPA: TonB-dependent receptor [Myxococcota bacterium]|nr:TonB-dependent receptor [Myxococcota bacterium]